MRSSSASVDTRRALTYSVIICSVIANLFVAVPSTSALDVTVKVGDYIRSESFSAVYAVDQGESGTLVRRPFMNEQIFFTWQQNFDDVVTVSDETLATLPIDSLVLPKSGVVLVKIQSTNEVYTVENDTLRWITTERIAVDMYGDNWADYVIDLPPTMFSSFTHGTALTYAEAPADTSVMKTRTELVATKTTTPFVLSKFYVDPDSSARRQILAWNSTRPADALALEKIALQPAARWLGDWVDDIRLSVDGYVTDATAAGTLPVLVAYNIPNRDCGQYSAGGTATSAEYRAWITGFAEGIGARSAIVILEPDATATDCVSEDRLSLLADAVRILKTQPHTVVYIDAGHDDWIPVATMAARLKAAGVGDADGFALNVSNFYTTEENTAYGTAVSNLIGGKHFVIDTSRNGNGWSGEWCNPTGRRVGTNPTTDTGNTLVDALLWVKPPGESDGTCNGGPEAGVWWAEYALGLVQ